MAVDLLLRSYIQYQSHHVLPASGGWIEQTRSWASAVEILEAEKSRLEQLVHDHNERERAAAQRKAKSRSTQHGRR